MFCILVFFFKQKTAYEMRISDWSSDVCSSDLFMEFAMNRVVPGKEFPPRNALISATEIGDETARFPHQQHTRRHVPRLEITFPETFIAACRHMGQIKRSRAEAANARSEEHTSELQSLMRNSYAVFCLKK